MYQLPLQGCAVSPNAGGRSGKRKKRDATSDTPEFLWDVVGMFEAAKRDKRDIRSVAKFIELALVLDKDMVRSQSVSLLVLIQSPAIRLFL